MTGRTGVPGSLAPDYGAIDAAILNVGGWMDSYVDAALRMQAACSAPSRTIVGNWVHDLPGRRHAGTRTSTTSTSWCASSTAG